MIATILPSSATFHAVEYNERKVSQGKAELLEMTNFGYVGNTGTYTWEELTDPANKRCHGDDTDAILSMTDVLVDGEFELDKRDLMLRFRGSSNQRVIDVKASLETGEVVLSKYNDRDTSRL